MKYFVGFIVGTFAMGLVLVFMPRSTGIPDVCSDAFYSLTAAHVVSVERLLEDDYDAALKAVEYASDAIESWSEKCE